MNRNKYHVLATIYVSHLVLVKNRNQCLVLVMNRDQYLVLVINHDQYLVLVMNVISIYN